MKVHFLGMGGSGASAAAGLAQAQGFEVSGCDLNPFNEFTTQFNKSQLLKGHSAKHLDQTDILAVTPAIFSLDPKNPELIEASQKNIPILTWQQFLGKYLTKNKFVIAICGTHGKTTTTAMISKILEDAHLDPTVLLGAIYTKWKTNYRTGHSKYLVVEADEFNDNFLSLKPDITIVTNIEMDHPEYFKNFDQVLESFRAFLSQTKKTIVANLQDPGVAQVLKDIMKMPNRPLRKYLDYSRSELNFELQIPGQFNRSNAKAALQVGLLLGIDPEIIKMSLSSFKGVSRRFELIGSYKGNQVFSDFGHHPTEIEKTVMAAREKFPRQKIWLIYQPHMFSRTKFLFDQFVAVFKRIPVEKITIMDIYPSREVDTGIISAKQLVNAINTQHISYSSWEKLSKELRHNNLYQVIFCMGAGDIDQKIKELLF